MPARYSPPQEIEEAMIIVEAGIVITPEALEEMPERLIHDIIVYKNVKRVSEVGGSYEA